MHTILDSIIVGEENSTDIHLHYTEHSSDLGETHAFRLLRGRIKTVGGYGVPEP